MRNMRIRRLIAMIMTVITVGAQSPLSAMAGELTEDNEAVETVADEEETSVETVETEETVVESVAEESITDETEQVSSNEAEDVAVPDEDIPVEEVTADEETESEYVLEGFTLTAADYSAKQALIDHDVLDAFASLTEGVDYVSNEMIFNADSKEYAEAVAKAYGATLKSCSDGVAILDMSTSQYSIGQAYALAADSKVALPVVEPNYIITLDDPADDYNPESGTAKAKNSTLEWKIAQWEDFGYYDPLLDPIDPNFQWWHSYIDSYGAWSIFSRSTSSSSSFSAPRLGDDIKVAVIDTGVAGYHEDLSGHTELADIGLGTTDENGHGTHVAGIIGATSHNYKGGAGVAPGIQLIGVRAGDKNGSFATANIVKAINKSVDSKADIINMSLGGPIYVAAENDACQSAISAGVTIVAAAGNDSKSGYSYPAAFENVISVGATEEAGYKTVFSNYGKWVDIMAPGAHMRSTFPDASSSGNNYVTYQGTSQASPVIAGACALYMSACGKVTPAEMADILKNSTTKCNTADASSSGIINVAKMLDGDTTGPQIDVLAEDSDTSIATAESGSFAECTTTVKASQYIKFTGKGFNGDKEANRNTSYFFTVNGSAPDPHNYGQTYTSYPEDYRSFIAGTGDDCTINAGELLWLAKYSKLTPATITLKVVAVTGRGIISGITSMQLTIDPEPIYRVRIKSNYYEYEAAYIAKGTSIQLYSQVYSRSSWTDYTADDVDQGVKWSIDSRGGCAGASIDDNGLLTVGDNDTGVVVVKAESTAYKDAYGIYFVNVTNRAKVASVELTSDLQTLLNDELVIKEWGDVMPELKLKMTLSDGSVITDNLPAVSWSSSDTWVAVVRDEVTESVSGNSLSGNKITTRKSYIYPKSKGSCTLTGTVQDGSNTQFTVNVKVRSLVYTFLTNNKQHEIAQGKSAKYKFEPVSYTQYYIWNHYNISKYKREYKTYGPNDKSFTWSIKDANGKSDIEIAGVSLKKGKLKVAKTVAAGTTFSVAATASDEGKSVGYIPVKVTAASNNITITALDNDAAYDIKVNKKGSVTSVQLFIKDVSTYTTSEKYVDEHEIRLKAVADNGAEIQWMKNNYKTGSVDYLYYNERNKYNYYFEPMEEGTIRIYSYGYKANTTYTAYVKDGTKKKAKVKVKVIVPVSSLEISSPAIYTQADPGEGEAITSLGQGFSQSFLAVGTPVKLSPVFGKEYGEPTNKKLKWEVTTADEALKAKVSLKNGKLKLAKDFPIGGVILVTASATDGTGKVAGKMIIACQKTTYIKYDQQAHVDFRESIVKEFMSQGLTEAQAKEEAKAYLVLLTDGNAVAYDVKTSNPDVAGLQYIGTEAYQPGVNMIVFYRANRPDKMERGVKYNFNITVTAMDGTRVKKTLAMTTGIE